MEEEDNYGWRQLIIINYILWKGGRRHGENRYGSNQTPYGAGKR